MLGVGKGLKMKKKNPKQRLLSISSRKYPRTFSRRMFLGVSVETQETKLSPHANKAVYSKYLNSVVATANANRKATNNIAT